MEYSSLCCIPKRMYILEMTRDIIFLKARKLVKGEDGHRRKVDSLNNLRDE